MEPDPIIDRSLVQKQIRLDKMRAELFDLGYSVVRTVWLRDFMDDRLPSVNLNTAATKQELRHGKEASGI